MVFATEAKAATGTVLAALERHARKAADLWLREAQATLPAGWLARFGVLARPVLTLRLAEGAIFGRLQGHAGSAAASWPTSAGSIALVSEWLEAQQLSRAAVSLEVELDADLFLLRKMVVPRAALVSLGAIAVQDIVHRSPFEPGDIWHTATPRFGPTSNEIIEVEHWIIRRDRAREALAQFGLAQEDVDALRIAGSEPRASIRLRETDSHEARWGGRLVRACAAAAFGITLLGAITVEWAASHETTRIANAISALRGQGAGANDAAARFLALKAGPGVLEVWDELSRLLPEHTFLSELRVADGAATITGFSGDATHLVRLLDQSGLFTAARLSGPITPDKAEHKDRFTLAFRLRGTPMPQERPGTAVARSEP